MRKFIGDLQCSRRYSCEKRGIRKRRFCKALKRFLPCSSEDKQLECEKETGTGGIDTAIVCKVIGTLLMMSILYSGSSDTVTPRVA